MNRIRLGESNIEISELGIGAWSWGDRVFWQFGKGYNREDVHAAFETSVASGINFFDTAEFYGIGQSEKFLGEYLRERNPGIVIATKFFPYPWRLRRVSLLNALRGSLARLKLSRVDLYQIHWPHPLIPIETWMAAMADAVDAGLTRAVGVSNYDAAQIRRANHALAQRGIALASNQVKYSLLDRRIERNGVMETCRELNVTIIAYSPIEMGLLTGKYTPANPPPGLRAFRYSRNFLAQIQPLIAAMREIGKAHGGKTPAQVALNWTMRKGTVPIPGAKNARQAKENIGAVGWRLKAGEIAALEAESEKLRR